MMNNTIERLMKSFCEYQNMQKQIDTIMKDIKQDIIAELEKEGVNEYVGTEHKVSYIDICSHVFDTKKFKAEHADIAELFMQEKHSKRFTVK